MQMIKCLPNNIIRALGEGSAHDQTVQYLFQTFSSEDTNVKDRGLPSATNDRHRKTQSQSVRETCQAAISDRL